MPRIVPRMMGGGLVSKHLGEVPPNTTEYITIPAKRVGGDTVPTILQRGELVVNKANVPKVLELIDKYNIKVPGLEDQKKIYGDKLLENMNTGGIAGGRDVSKYFEKPVERTYKLPLTKRVLPAKEIEKKEPKKVIKKVYKTQRGKPVKTPKGNIIVQILPKKAPARAKPVPKPASTTDNVLKGLLAKLLMSEQEKSKEAKKEPKKEPKKSATIATQTIASTSTGGTQTQEEEYQEEYKPLFSQSKILIPSKRVNIVEPPLVRRVIDLPEPAVIRGTVEEEMRSGTGGITRTLGRDTQKAIKERKVVPSPGLPKGPIIRAQTEDFTVVQPPIQRVIDVGTETEVELPPLVEEAETQTEMEELPIERDIALEMAGEIVGPSIGQALEQEVMRRRGGRPKGARNKPKGGVMVIEEAMEPIMPPLDIQQIIEESPEEEIQGQVRRQVRTIERKIKESKSKKK